MDYFAAYPTFTLDPHLPILQNFNRLAKAQGWGEKRTKKERQIYLQGQYTIHLGSISTGKLQSWQSLCQELRVDPIPTSIIQCKKVCYDNGSDNCLCFDRGFILAYPKNPSVKPFISCLCLFWIQWKREN